jgi:hypothetical protein
MGSSHTFILSHLSAFLLFFAINWSVVNSSYFDLAALRFVLFLIDVNFNNLNE